MVDLVLTPFSVNKNNQKIPRSEAENIVRTCLHQPIKVDLTVNGVGGHKNAIPVGVITHGEENETEIIGKGVIWKNEFPQVTAYLEQKTAENDPPGTSWEILHMSSEIDEDGSESLYGTYYAAIAIVANPSYGNQTLIRAVAEDLHTESVHVEEERTEISSLQEMLNSLYYMLDDLYFKTFEIEQAEAIKTENVDSFSTRLNDLVSKLTDRANQAGVALAEKQTLEERLATIQTELDALKQEKVLAERSVQLAELNITLENKESILAMTSDQFNMFVSGIKQVKQTVKTTAETRIVLPEPIIDQGTDTQAIIESHKALFRKR